MNEVEPMAMYEAKTAKKVYLYKNGAKHAQPKCMVVNDRQIRDFSTFLNRVTSGIRAPAAVRNIYTPNEGHHVNKLDDLHSGQYYVAGGSEQFKKIKYGEDVLKSPTKKQRTDFFVPHRSQPILITTSRYKKPVEKPFVIHMFRNGDEKYRGARILLPRKIMGSWEHVQELITQKADLIIPVKRICTLDGRTIHSVSELQDGGKYVAIEGSKSFQKVSYCATDEKRLPLVRSIPRAAIRVRHKSEHLTGSEGEEGLIDIANAPFVSKKRHGTLKRRKKSIRPMAGRKNKEGREKAIKDHREDSIFGGSPPLERDLDRSFRVAKMPSPPLKSSLTAFNVAADSDKGGHPNHLESSLEEPLCEPLPALTEIQEVNESSSEPAGPVLTTASNTDPVPLQTSATHTSKSEEKNVAEKVQNDTDGQHRKSLEAETIPEGGETEVERPIDQREADEVEELNGTQADVLMPAHQAKDIHLERQKTQASVDLSLQRTTPKTTTELSVTERISKGPSKSPSVASSRGPSKPSSRHSVANSKGPSKFPSLVVSRGPSNPNSRGPSKPPSVAKSRGASKPNSRGPSKPPSRHSIASELSTSHTNPKDKAGEVEQQVEEAVNEVVPEEIEEVHEDTVQMSDSTPPTPPFNSPQEPPEVQEQLEDQT